jgi:hypothetical protein
MNRAFSGKVITAGSDRPLPGLLVAVLRLCHADIQVIGAGLTYDFGRFRVTYPPLGEPADLFLMIFSPDGRHLFTEPVHWQVSGSELQVRVEVPKTALNQTLH